MPGPNGTNLTCRLILRLILSCPILDRLSKMPHHSSISISNRGQADRDTCTRAFEGLTPVLTPHSPSLERGVSAWASGLNQLCCARIIIRSPSGVVGTILRVARRSRTCPRPTVQEGWRRPGGSGGGGQLVDVPYQPLVVLEMARAPPGGVYLGRTYSDKRRRMTSTTGTYTKSV